MRFRNRYYLADFFNSIGSQEAKIAVFSQNCPCSPVLFADSHRFDASNLFEPGQKAELAISSAPPVFVGPEDVGVVFLPYFDHSPGRQSFEILDRRHPRRSANRPRNNLEKQPVPSENPPESGASYLAKPRFDPLATIQNRIQITLIQNYKVVIAHSIGLHPQDNITPLPAYQGLIAIYQPIPEVPL